MDHLVQTFKSKEYPSQYFECKVDLVKTEDTLYQYFKKHEWLTHNLESMVAQTLI